MVGDLLRAQDDVLAVTCRLRVHLLRVLGGQREGRRRGDGHLAGVDQVDHAVLDHLGVGGDVLELRVQEPCHHGVGHVAHTGLHDVAVVRQASGTDLALQEVQEVAGDLLRGLVRRGERCVAVRTVGLDDGDDLAGVELEGRAADAVTRGGDADGGALPGRLDAVDVVHALEVARLPLVDLDDHLVRGVDVLDVVAHGRGRDDRAVLPDGDSLDDGDVELAEEALLHLLTEVGEVDVPVLRLTGVDLPAQDRIGVVGGAETDGVGLGEDTVTVDGGRGAGEQLDLEVVAAVVGRLGALGDGGGEGLGVTRSGESRGAHLVAVVDELRGLLRRHDLRLQSAVCDAIRHSFSSICPVVIGIISANITICFCSKRDLCHH